MSNEKEQLKEQEQSNISVDASAKPEIPGAASPVTESSLNPDKSFSNTAKVVAISVALSFLLITPLASVLGLYLSKKISNGSTPLVAIVDMERATEDAMTLAKKSKDPQKAANLVVASILAKAGELKNKGYVILDKKSVLAAPETIEVIEWKSVYREMRDRGEDPIALLKDDLLEKNEVTDLIDMDIFEKAK